MDDSILAIPSPIVGTMDDEKNEALLDTEVYSPHRQWMDSTFQATVDERLRLQKTYVVSEQKSDMESSELSRSSSESSLDSASTFVVSTARSSAIQPDLEKTISAEPPSDNRSIIFEKVVSFDTLKDNYDNDDMSLDEDSVLILNKTEVVVPHEEDRCSQSSQEASGRTYTSNERNSIEDLMNASEAPTVVSPPVPARRGGPIVSPDTPSHSRQLLECPGYHNRIHSLESEVALLIETNESMSKFLEEREIAHENQMRHLKEEIQSLKSLFSALSGQLESPPPITNLRTRACDNNIYQVEWDLKAVEGYEVILNGERTGDIVQQKKCYLSDVLEKTSVQIQAIGITGARGDVSDPVIIRPHKK